MYPVFEENELIVLILWIYNNAKHNSFNLLFTYSSLFFKDIVRFSHENKDIPFLEFVLIVNIVNSQ